MNSCVNSSGIVSVYVWGVYIVQLSSKGISNSIPSH